MRIRIRFTYRNRIRICWKLRPQMRNGWESAGNKCPFPFSTASGGQIGFIGFNALGIDSSIHNHRANFMQLENYGSKPCESIRRHLNPVSKIDKRHAKGWWSVFWILWPNGDWGNKNIANHWIPPTIVITSHFNTGFGESASPKISAKRAKNTVGVHENGGEKVEAPGNWSK